MYAPDKLLSFADLTIPNIAYNGIPTVDIHTTLYTVPAGKTLYLQAISMGIRYGVNNVVTIFHRTAAPADIQSILSGSSGGGSSHSFIPMLKLDETDIITLVPTGTATQTNVQLQGYLL